MEAFSFKYGRVEISAKLPTGDWLWPALWLMPKHSVYGGWPRSGEIDLMEARGNRQMFAGDTHIGVEQYGSTLHFGTEWYNSAWWSSHFVKNTQPEKGLNRGYHLYQMEWAPCIFTIRDFLFKSIELFSICQPILVLAWTMNGSVQFRQEMVTLNGANLPDTIHGLMVDSMLHLIRR